ncbi:MAG: hypothetical protein ABFS56_02050 [Pseudomonadota bacterium]
MNKPPAQKFYVHDGVKRAVIEAIKLWLAMQRKRQMDLAPDAQHRIVMQVGERRPKEVELGSKL